MGYTSNSSSHLQQVAQDHWVHHPLWGADVFPPPKDELHYKLHFIEKYNVMYYLFDARAENIIVCVRVNM